MNDQKLLAQSEDGLKQLVSQAFTDYRHGDILALSNSELAESSLTAPCFLEGERITPALRGRATAKWRAKLDRVRVALS